MGKGTRPTITGLIFRTLRHELACRRAERQLLEMPEHMLRDLGIGRDEVTGAVRGFR